MKHLILSVLILSGLLVNYYSCKSDKQRQNHKYNESLAEEFELNNNRLENYNKVRDSLAMIEKFKKDALNKIDSLLLETEKIKAKYEFQYGKVPSKIEFRILKVEEIAGNLKYKIRYSKEETRNWHLFQSQVNEELVKITKSIKNL
ncbi:MAG: hypothetical protein ACM3PX_10800 [Omnitrophica WOR_2 bacterium]|jgi:predicted nuclease with TOPRIM domain